MNTVWPEPARVGAKLMQAPTSRPGNKMLLAKEAGPGDWLRLPASATGVFARSSILKAPKASVIPSASTSAVRSRSGEPGKCRLLDAAVLRERDVLAGRRVDVEDREDDHENLVLPYGDVERLVSDRGRQHD